jgi:Fe-S oxidoreductase
VPAVWRERFANPLFSGPGPATGYKNLSETLRLNQGNIFVPANGAQGSREAVLHFPGCGGGLFYRNIGMAGIALLLRAGVAVVLPPEHLCCGYPLLSAGADRAYAKNREHTMKCMAETLKTAAEAGLNVTHALTACGTCRDSMQRYELKRLTAEGKTPLAHQDVAQFLLTRLDSAPKFPEELKDVLYHPSCHAEWVGAHKAKAAGIYARNLADFTGVTVQQNTGCCGESGMGAMTSPAIYNKLRARKKNRMTAVLPKYGETKPIIVGCPSCKIGIARTLISLHARNPVLHTLEWLAEGFYGAGWQDTVRQTLRKAKAAKKGSVVRVADMA